MINTSGKFVMIKYFILFFIEIAFITNGYAGINGSADPRIVIGWDGERPDYIDSTTQNLWNTSPYNSIVRIERDNSYGTGEFISPRHILTNAHVAMDCGINNNKECEIYTSDDDLQFGRVVFRGMKVLKSDGAFDEDKVYEHPDRDWAILEITGDYCRPEYREMIEAGTIERGLWRAGFGSLRVLDKTDLDNIRRAYLVYLDAGGTDGTETGGMNIDEREQKYQIFREEFLRITGKDFETDYDSDILTLKKIQNCRFRDVVEGFPGDSVLWHSCSGWTGDSGSTLKMMSGNLVVGVHNNSYLNITSYTDHTRSDMALGSSTFMYNPKIQSAIEKAKQDCKN